MADASTQLAEAKAALTALETTNSTMQAQLTALHTKLYAIDVGPVTVEADAAYGNGTTDATTYIQGLVNACPAGGVVSLPAGTFLIDATRSINLKSKMTLQMAANTILKVKPNGATRYYALRISGVSDVKIKGGQILGDRLLHDYTQASTHEWGYGIGINGSRITVEDTRISECTGDGLSVTGSDIELRNVESTKNRRQGASFFRVGPNVKCYGCKFNQTGDLNGNEGTAPQAGVDIEPDAGAAMDVLFEDCEFNDNATAGLLLWTRSGTGASITNIIARGCTIRGNANGIHAKGLAGPVITAGVYGCTISQNTGSGIRVEGGTNIIIGGAGEAANTFVSVAQRTDFDLTGRDSRTTNDIRVLVGGVVSVGLNHYQ